MCCECIFFNIRLFFFYKLLCLLQAAPDNIGSEAPIPDGLPEEGYRVEIIARAYDQVGAFADKITYVRVSCTDVLVYLSYSI